MLNVCLHTLDNAFLAVSALSIINCPLDDFFFSVTPGQCISVVTPVQYWCAESNNRDLLKDALQRSPGKNNTNSEPHSIGLSP